MTDKKSKIAAKIEALLQLAANNTSVEEAAAAAAKAQELAFQYNIDLEQVRANAKQKGEAVTAVAYGRTVVSLYRKGQTQWRSLLLNDIAHANFGRIVLLHGLNAQKHKLAEVFGTEDNRQIIQALYEYLTVQILELGKAAWKEYYKTHRWTSESEREWTRTYSFGAVQTVCRKLREQRKYSEQNLQRSSGSTALVLQSEQRLELAFADAYPALGRARSVSIRGSADAFEKGRRDAESIEINPSLGRNKKMLEG